MPTPYPTAPTPAPSHSPTPLYECHSTYDGYGNEQCNDCNNGAYGDPDYISCSSNWGEPNAAGIGTYCGAQYDDHDFRAMEMCCVCGGGSTGSVYSKAPTPNPTPAPT